MDDAWPMSGWQYMEAEIERLRAELAYEKAARQAETNRAAALSAELAKCRAAIEAMRTAGGAKEFQCAFDAAKAISARKGEEGSDA